MNESLNSLAVAAERAAAELARELRPEEVQAVREWSDGLSEAQMTEWFREHRREILWLMSSTPRQRSARASLKKQWRCHLMYWTVSILTEGSRIAWALGEAPLPQIPSRSREFVGGVWGLIGLGDKLNAEARKPVWNEEGEYWP